MQQRADLSAMFETACRWVAARPFLIDDARRLNGHEAALAARQGAARMRAAGLQPQQVVAFLCGPSVDHAVAFFAVQRAGGVACCLHTRDTDARLADTLAEVRPALVIADADEEDRALRVAVGSNTGARVMSVTEIAALADGAEEAPEAMAEAGDLAAIILSSGSTGRPKQVLHSHRSLQATAMMAGPIYGALGPQDSLVVPMAPSFAAWIHTVLPFVAQRGKLVFQRRFDTENYLDLLEREEITIAALVPTLWRMVLPALEKRRLPKLRVGMFSGEPGTPDLVAALRRLVPSIRSVYLASEAGCGCGVVATEHELSREGLAAVAGQPVAGGDVRIIDPGSAEFAPLPDGETGEIALFGPSMSPGYLGQPELTAAKFLNGWWRTGDLGLIDAEGLVHMRGRLDNRINSGGMKVHAEEIEAALMQLDIVRAAAVIGVPDAQWGERIEAHVTLADRTVTTEQLAAAFENATKLPRSMQPKRFHIHDALPTGPTGKLYRRALRDGACS